MRTRYNRSDVIERVRAILAGAAAWLVAGLLLAMPAHSAGRLALVIGNSHYAAAPVLTNPANDAADLARSLRGIGFEVVEATDATRAEMADAIRSFSAKLPEKDLTLFFYAGHGLQVEGENFLVPVDARVDSVADVRLNTINMSDLVRIMDGQTSANIIILDACRDNPFPTAVGTKRGAPTRGLSRIDTPASGTLIVDSTQPNNVALDGSGRNSPFTAALLKQIDVPGLEIRRMMSKVRADVVSATQRKQIPWDSSSLEGDVYLAPVAAEGTSDKAAAESAEDAFWHRAESAGTAETFAGYLTQYGQAGRYSAEARRRLAALAKAPEPRSRGETGQMTGVWDGAASCGNGQRFAITLDLTRQDGSSASGDWRWTGSNHGTDKAHLAPKPGAVDGSYLLIMDSSSVYSYGVTRSGNVLKGRSSGREDCALRLEREGDSAPASDRVGAEGTPLPSATLPSLTGAWAGAILCPNDQHFAATLDLSAQHGSTASGEWRWTGSNRGTDKAHLGLNPRAEDGSYLLVMESSAVYPYVLTLSGDVFAGTSSAKQACSVRLDRVDSGTAGRDHAGAEGTPLPVGPTPSLLGSWTGVVTCANARHFAAALEVARQSGGAAVGKWTYTGSSRGTDTAHLSRSPVEPDDAAYVLIMDSSSTYAYSLKLGAPDLLAGKSMGSEKCDVRLERSSAEATKE